MPRLQKSDAEARKGESAEFLEALSRGIKIIRAFNDLPSPTTLSDLGRSVHLPRATVRRTLLTLNRLGYVRTDGRQFWLTSQILDLASSYLASNKVGTLFQPACDKLAQEMGVTVTVAVLAGADAHYIATAQTERTFLQETSVGYRVPAFCTSLGRVLLAAMPLQKFDTYLRAAKLTPRNNRTVTDKRALRAAIAEVAKQGFALVDQEASLGFRSIAVPLRRYDDVVVAAMSAAAHIELATFDYLRNKCLPQLLACAGQLRSQII
jgi:IclR family transcriptional regulator, pca regulon regulatory protein